MKKIPDRGDIIICDFNPKAGHEQAGLRPAVVVSPSELNSLTNLVTVCPITSTVRNNFFEVKINNKKTKGVILTYQIKTIDYIARKVIIVDKIEKNLLEEVIGKIRVLFEG